MQPRLKAGWRSSRASVIAVTCAHFLFTILSSSQPFMNWYSALNTQPFRNNLIWQALVKMEFCIRKGFQWKIFANQTCRSSRMRFPGPTTFGAVGQQGFGDNCPTVSGRERKKGECVWREWSFSYIWSQRVNPVPTTPSTSVAGSGCTSGQKNKTNWMEPNSSVIQWLLPPLDKPVQNQPA